MTMGVCWMFVVLLGCGSSLLTRSESACDCNERSETLYFTANTTSSVTIPCHNLTKYEEFTYNLFKDNALIYSHNYTKMEQSPNSKHLDSWSTVSMMKNTQGEFLGFKLTGAKSRSQGIYRCQAIGTYPPPLINNCSQRVVVLIQEDKEESPKLVVTHDLWIWILVVVLLSIYSLIISIYAVYNTVKLKGTECNNDYMNTKPRAPMGRRNNRGIQTPIPRHF